MGLFVTISRYTPEQAEAAEKRWDTMLKGTAPKAVMDALAKMKIIAQVASPQNGFSLMIVDVTDQTPGWMEPYSADTWQTCAPWKVIRSSVWKIG